MAEHLSRSSLRASVGTGDCVGTGASSLCRNPTLDLISTRELRHEQTCQTFCPTTPSKRSCYRPMCVMCWVPIIFVFCCDVVESWDLQEFVEAYSDAGGQSPYHPRLMVKV